MDFDGGYVLGNVMQDSLETIWRRSRPQFEEHVLGRYTREVCRKCARLDEAVPTLSSRAEMSSNA